MGTPALGRVTETDLSGAATDWQRATPANAPATITPAAMIRTTARRLGAQSRIAIALILHRMSHREFSWTRPLLAAMPKELQILPLR